MSPDRRRVMCQLWLVASGLLAACFEPDLPACLACDGVCPAGQRCIEGLCVAEGERCEPVRAPQEPDSGCSPARCCISDECFERSAGAEFRIAAWLDWTSIVTRGSQRAFDVWEDRSGQQHAARSQHSDVLPLVRPVAFRDSGRDVVERVAEEDYLVLDQEPGDVLDLLGRGDFFVVAAVALDCAERDGRACIASKWMTPSRGFILAVNEKKRVEATVSECSERNFSATCMPQFGTEAGFAPCGRFQLIGLRRATDTVAATQLELRVDGVVVDSVPTRMLDTSSAGQTHLGGYANCRDLRGSLAVLVAIDGAMTDREVCELERTLLRAMQTADLAESAAPSCE